MLRFGSAGTQAARMLRFGSAGTQAARMLRFASAGIQAARMLRFASASCRVVAVLGVGVFLGGCGEEEEDGEFSPVVAEPPSRVEFLREADRICHATEARIEAAADELVTAEKEPSPAEVERVALGVVVPALEAEVQAIRSLGAPKGDEQEVEAILEATEQGIEAIEANPRDISGGVPADLRRAERLAREYGSDQCGIR